MKVSLNTVQSLIDFELPPVDELVHRINQQLGGVEEVIDLGDKYQGVVIVRVVSAVKHENADKLNVCMVDDGGVVADVERDENGHVQVVCGAPNVHDDMFAAWLPPKSTVPSSYDDAEPFVLESRELRGVISNGMLASAKELAIGTDHDGIVEIDPAEAHPNGTEIVPGTSFAEAYGLDDTIIDIENKMFTHRPDCFGQLGVAREIAGILGHQFESPSWYSDEPNFTDASGLELEVFNDAGNVPRFMAVAMKDVEIKPSPLWLQCALVAMGSKAINNIVDATNYIMLMTAQPTHAYDYDKLRGHTLGVRMAQDGESVELLNGKTYELDSSDIVIVDGEGPVGLGGVMGGGNSEVSETTTRIVLEVATFDMYAVRKTSMRHGLFTDALTRFNKGQSPLQNDRILKELMNLISGISDAKPACEVKDTPAIQEDYFLEDGAHLSHPVIVDHDFINSRLGMKLSPEQQADILENVEFRVELDNRLHVHMPFWRTDIELPEDVVEEVGRLYGFDKLPRELPQRSIKPAKVNKRVLLKRSLRSSLLRAGANEVLTYSFVHEKVLKNSGQDPEKAFRLSNALSPDLQFYRLSVLPSLIDKVHMNVRAGHDEFTLYEIGKGHHKQEFDEDGTPKEFDRLAAIYTNKKQIDGAPYYYMRTLVQRLALDNNFSVHFKKLSDFDFGEHDMMRQMCAPFDPERSAIVMRGEQFGGVVGELRQHVAQKFKLPPCTSACELFLSLFEKNSADVTYHPLSKFPSITQDLSLKVSSDTSYESLFGVVYETLQSKSHDSTLILSPVTIYQPEDDASTKTVTLRLQVTSHQRTLKEEEVTALLDAAAEVAQRRLNAVQV